MRRSFRVSSSSRRACLCRRALGFLGVPRRRGDDKLRLSARNKLEGTITRITLDGGSAQVELAVGENRIVASITAEAVEELGLEEGATAWAVVKASDVMIGAPH
jgi:molybdopterin-binding protein